MPLIVSWPGRIDGGRRIPGRVELVDLYPTLRDLVAPGTEVPGLEGHSLVPFLEGEYPREARRRRPVPVRLRRGRGRLADDPLPLGARRPLEADLPPAAGSAPAHLGALRPRQRPGETRNLVDSETHQFQRLRSTLAAWMKGSEWIRQPQSEVEVRSEETEKALKALGYIN